MNYIKNNQIDVYELIFNNLTNLKVTLNPNFIISLSKEYKSSIPINILKKLKIPKEKIYSNILYFSKATGRKTKLPRYIKLDKDFMYGIGLYLGEGKNSDKGKKRIGISNSKKEIIEFSIKWLTKYFKIKKNGLKFYIYKPINKNNLNVTQVYYDSSIIRKIIDYLKENLIPLCFKNKQFGISFLQGVFDGEGSVSINSKNREVKLILEMKNPLVINTIRFILHENKIDTNKPKSNKFKIYTATRDYYRIKKLQPFKFNLKNKQKLENAEKIVKRLQTFKGGLFFELLDYMKQNRERSFMMDELYNLIKRKGRANIHFRYAIKKAIKLNLIERNGIGTKYDPFEHIITKKGINYISKEKLAKINHYNCLRANIYNSIQSRWDNGS